MLYNFAFALVTLFFFVIIYNIIVILNNILGEFIIPACMCCCILCMTICEYKYSLKKIMVEIRHGGNQGIPELSNGKNICFELHESKNIKDVKNEIIKKIKFSSNAILLPSVFGDELPDNFILRWITDESNICKLFIVIPNY
jgi:hypothetical protein